MKKCVPNITQQYPLLRANFSLISPRFESQCQILIQKSVLEIDVTLPITKENQPNVFSKIINSVNLFSKWWYLHRTNLLLEIILPANNADKLIGIFQTNEKVVTKYMNSIEKYRNDI